ncbi:hypothetical protein A5844_001899 [Enterococcus sp. 10A9_DIV0425]|uniref:Uncharacterized protein n=1 Tax=Candidatus Enterococcus wittei TaxID=1987383 RepID=A0A242JZ48_9ENTE|nr:hypothetical protein A5844_001899 [Enterococcus sp. 10A9_DIV0425]
MILPKGIYSNETALYIHDLTDKFPYTVWMNFPVRILHMILERMD